MAAASLGVLACSGSTTLFPDGSGGSGTTAESASSAGGAGVGGNGGGCELDCSALQTPPCLQSVCDEASGQCIVVVGPSGGPCEDGLFCTVGETCADGICGGGAQNTCGLPSDACTAIVCDEATAACGATPTPNGGPCATDNLCIVNPTCQNGQCVGPTKSCFGAPVPDACHVAVCAPPSGDCVPQPGNDGGPCPNDGDLCMVAKTCAGGLCLGGVPKDCSAFTNGCNNGVCDPMGGDCYSEAVPPGGVCAEATDDCNVGICDNGGNCNPVPANEGAACNDGNACTMGEACQVGACTGGVVGNYEVYFSETFASNNAGWTLGTEWQIESAMASVGMPFGNQDPAEDHTATGDNGIAGVVIGGYATIALHAPYYLESPIIDVSAAPGPVYLEFWRFLNSDYTPWMDNRIEVFDGVSWITVWTSGNFPIINDAAWTRISHDLTAYKGPSMRVRFGVEVGMAGAFTVSSWNVDDVVIANAVCD